SFLAGQRVPHLYRPVSTTTGQAQAVCAEDHAHDRAPMALEGEAFLAYGHVPHLHGLVPAAAGQALSVRAEGQAPHPSLVLEGEDLLARDRIAHLHRPVI